MSEFKHLETDTGTNVDISGVTAIGSYTATADKLVMCDVSIDAVAGNGDYIMFVKRKIGGTGSDYVVLPKTTMTAASGETAISAQSGWITVRNGDVLTVYIDGLAGDTSTPDWTTRWFEDSGTAGVAVASIANDAITAAALKADAVTKIQNGLALEATLTAIKGAGWTNETLVAINNAISLGFNGASVEDTINAAIAQMLGAGWTNETLVKIVSDIAALSVGSGAMPQQIWEYATRVLTAGTNIDLSSLATAANLATLDGKADAILEDTGTTIPALLETIDNFLDTEVAAILEDTGTTLPATLATIAGHTDGIAGDVWSHATRTLTVPAVAAAATEDGTTLTLYKDADINIEFTGLTIPTGAKKVVFTIKDNLDDADTASALQATYQLTAVPAETHTLNYINSAVPPVLTTPVTFTVDTDSVEFDMTAAAAYYLPRYERGYLHWDLKLITATTVQILQQGLVQILGTSTRAVA